MLTEDVCLPRGKLAEMLALIEEIGGRTTSRSRRSRTRATATCTRCLVTPKGDEAGRDRALAAFQAIIDTALDLGGTVTGEHGVGLLKRAGMQREVGPVSMAMQRAIKTALDPNGILNPGKVIG